MKADDMLLLSFPSIVILVIVFGDLIQIVGIGQTYINQYQFFYWHFMQLGSIAALKLYLPGIVERVKTEKEITRIIEWV